MDYPQILCKAFLKLKVTTIILVMSKHFPQEILKQLDMNYIQNISYVAPKIWNLVPKEMKQIPTLYEFKVKIRIWKLENRPCRLYRTYLPPIGFIR